ncbi:MAG TPA: Hsp70 family protein, partial [Planctomycetota bacterium]|nr:Hsp70 family protein [Planctomycetota bacterium]
LGGAMNVMIARNTTIPTQKKELYTTAEDGQRAVDIKVFRGERKLTKDNRSLGTFRLDGIPPAPAKSPKIEVTFDIDANGILNVTAKDLGTNKEQKITIQGGSGLSKADVERMKHEAEQNAADDEKRFKVVEAKNKADHVILATEKMIKENPEQLGAAKAEIEEKLKDLKAARDSNDPDRIERSLEDLTKVQHKMAEEMYKKATAAGPSMGGQSGGGNGHGPEAHGGGEKSKEDDVIDADYEVKS